MEEESKVMKKSLLGNVSSASMVYDEAGLSYDDEEEAIICRAPMVDNEAGLCYDAEKEAMICRVPMPLKVGREGLYTPDVVAIGPYHRHLINAAASDHGDQFEEMERYKVRGARAMEGGMRAGAMGELVQEIRARLRDQPLYYETAGSASDTTVDDHDLTHTIAMDALFVVGVLHSFYNEHGRRHQEQCKKGFNGAPLFSPPSFESPFKPIYSTHFSRPIRKALIRDFLLLENQIPLFALKKVLELHTSCRSEEQAAYWLEELVAALAYRVLPFPDAIQQVACAAIGLGRKGKHLLDCLYQIVTYNDGGPQEGTTGANADIVVVEMSRAKPHPVQYPSELPNAGQLFRAGISLGGHDQGLTNIYFSKRKLLIPRVHVGDDTERLLRNLLAYEATMPNCIHILSYLHFMNYLVDTPNDVDLLVEYQVMTENIGDHKSAAAMWNELCKNTVPAFSSRYGDTSQALRDEFYHNRLGRLWAEFHHHYLSRPWLVVSLIAAALELILTFITMLFTILLYHHKS